MKKLLFIFLMYVSTNAFAFDQCPNFAGNWEGTWRVVPLNQEGKSYSAKSAHKIDGEHVLVSTLVDGKENVYFYGSCRWGGDVSLSGAVLQLDGYIIGTQILLTGTSKIDSSYFELKLSKK